MSPQPISASLDSTVNLGGIEVSSAGDGVDVRRVDWVYQVCATGLITGLTILGSFFVAKLLTDSWLWAMLTGAGFLPVALISYFMLKPIFPASIYPNGTVTRRYLGWQRNLELGLPISVIVVPKPMTIKGVHLPFCDLVVSGPSGSESIAQGGVKLIDPLRQEVDRRLIALGGRQIS